MCGIQAAQPRPASEPYLPSNHLSPDHQAPWSNTGGPSVATCPRRKMSGPHKIRKIDIDDTVVEVAKAVPGTSTDPPARSNAPSTARTNDPDRAADAAVRSWCSAGAQDCGKSQPPRYKTGKFYHLSVSLSVPHCLVSFRTERLTVYAVIKSSILNPVYYYIQDVIKSSILNPVYAVIKVLMCSSTDMLAFWPKTDPHIDICLQTHKTK